MRAQGISWEREDIFTNSTSATNSNYVVEWVNPRRGDACTTILEMEFAEGETEKFLFCVFSSFLSLSLLLRVLNLQCSVQNYDHLGYFIAFLTSSRIEWRENKRKQIFWRRLYNAIFLLKRSSVESTWSNISWFFFGYMEPLCNIRSTFLFLFYA